MALFLAAGSSGELATSPDGSTWTTQTSSFGTTRIQALCYGNGLYVAAGVGGLLATSPDGVTWTQRTSSFGTSNINGLAYGAGVFVAVGAGGKIATSADGVTWTQRTSPYTTDLLGVCYGNGLFVAVGYTNTSTAYAGLATSPDGVTWTNRSASPVPTGRNITGVVYGGGRYVAVVSNETVLRSTDAVTWTLATTSLLSQFDCVTYGNGVYVLGGDSGVIATSTDAATWTTRTPGVANTNTRGLAYAAGKFVAGGSLGDICTSTDGSTWTKVTRLSAQQDIYAVSANPNVAPNAPTLSAPADGATLDRTSTNRFSWTFSDPDAGDSQSAFDLRYSSDGGSTWTTVSGSTPNQYVDIASGTFAAGSYEWQARTYDAAGTPSASWSPSRFFTAATPPSAVTITAPTNGATIGAATSLVQWSAPSQDSYQVRTVKDTAGSADPSTIYSDTGEVPVPGARSLQVAYATNGITVHTQVRIKKNGLWSSYADVGNPVSYTPPATPTLTVAVVTVDGKQAALQVTPAQPTPSGSQPTVTSVDIYRRVVGDTGPGQRYATAQGPTAPWVDYRVASGVAYEYLVRAVGSNDTTSDSAWTA